MPPPPEAPHPPGDPPAGSNVIQRLFGNFSRATGEAMNVSDHDAKLKVCVIFRRALADVRRERTGLVPSCQADHSLPKDVWLDGATAESPGWDAGCDDCAADEKAAHDLDALAADIEALHLCAGAPAQRRPER
jgi:hypothetical protein